MLMNFHRRNIYFVPPSSGKTRNIFLQPFSSELLVCVVITYFFIIATMEVITFVAKITHHDEDRKHAGLGEATLWCFSIMCMQGFVFPYLYLMKKKQINQSI